MNTQQWGNLLAYLCFPAVNIFWLLYAWTAPWWKSWSGCAVIISTLGLAALVDASVLFRLLGDDYPGRQQIVLVAFGVITVGTYLYLIAFARVQYLKRHKHSGETA